MWKTFKGMIISPYISVDQNKSSKSIVKFNRYRVYIPEENNMRFENSQIKDNATYILHKKDNVELTDRYCITLADKNEIRLIVNKREERKLKWIHGYTLFHEEKLATIAIIISILSIVLSVILRML